MSLLFFVGTEPRKEQLIRATRAQELNMLRCLTDDGLRRTSDMVRALNQLPEQPFPSDSMPVDLLSGLQTISDWVRRLVYPQQNQTIRSVSN